MAEVGYCEHPAHVGDEPSATNRIGDEWFCDEHLENPEQKWMGVGVYYCTTHDGVMNDDEEVCDFADEEVDDDNEYVNQCNRLQLFYKISASCAD